MSPAIKARTPRERERATTTQRSKKLVPAFIPHKTGRATSELPDRKKPARSPCKKILQPRTAAPDQKISKFGTHFFYYLRTCTSLESFINWKAVYSRESVSCHRGEFRVRRRKRGGKKSGEGSSKLGAMGIGTEVVHQFTVLL